MKNFVHTTLARKGTPVPVDEQGNASVSDRLSVGRCRRLPGTAADMEPVRVCDTAEAALAFLAFLTACFLASGRTTEPLGVRLKYSASNGEETHALETGMIAALSVGFGLAQSVDCHAVFA